MKKLRENIENIVVTEKCKMFTIKGNRTTYVQLNDGRIVDINRIKEKRMR